MVVLGVTVTSREVEPLLQLHEPPEPGCGPNFTLVPAEIVTVLVCDQVLPPLVER